MSREYDAKILAALNGENVTEAANNDAIHRAFNGLPSVAEEAAQDEVHRALNGLPSVTKEAVNRAILRSFGNESGTIMGKGARQDDDYLAQMGMDAAKESLRNRLMTTDPKLTAGAAELQVDVAAEAAYVAAEAHKYEADRLASVTETLKAHAKTTAAPTATPKASGTVIFESIPGGGSRRVQ